MAGLQQDSGNNGCASGNRDSNTVKNSGNPAPLSHLLPTLGEVDKYPKAVYPDAMPDFKRSRKQLLLALVGALVWLAAIGAFLILAKLADYRL